MKAKQKSLHLIRLRKLAQHLESGQLIHERFNISVYNDNEAEIKKGTAQFQIRRPNDIHYKDGVAKMGNAIGECPHVFKKEWLFKRIESESLGVQFVPVLNYQNPKVHDAEMISAMNFFQLTEKEFLQIFSPYGQKSKQLNGWPVLNCGSSPEDQAKVIRLYITEKAAQFNLQITL